MSLDIKSRREKLKKDNVNINLVPFIDILFTILIFIVVTSSFAGTATDANSHQTSDAIVNGKDMSYLIQDDAIAIHARVIDQGQITVNNKDKSIEITTPSGMSPNQAVRKPNQ